MSRKFTINKLALNIAAFIYSLFHSMSFLPLVLRGKLICKGCFLNGCKFNISKKGRIILREGLYCKDVKMNAWGG